MDFPLRWERALGYQLGGMVSAVVNDRRYVYLTGISHESTPRTARVWCLDGDGCDVWVHELSHPDEHRFACVFPNILHIPDKGVCLFYSSGSSDNDHPHPGYTRLCDAGTGELIWEGRTRSHHAGNGSCVAVDINGDGETELLFWDSTTVFCLNAATGAEKWHFDDRVRICHGRPTVYDVNGNGLPELVFGTEYSNDDGTSSLVALDGGGQVVWRTDGPIDDLGSTPVICTDADGDGAPEFYITGLDLEGRSGEEFSSLWAFDVNGHLIYRAPCGCGGLAVAPLADDGHISGAGMTNSRDGGRHGLAEIRCFDLRDGSLEWSIPAPRVYLDAQNPVAADLSGDGRCDLLLCTGNPSDYGRSNRWEPFADIYAVSGQGEVLWTTTVSDNVHQPFVDDIDDDGRNELLLPGADGMLRCCETPGIASETPWEMTGGGVERRYATP